MEKQIKSQESERPYCLYSPVADKAKGCYGSQLEPESNLEKPQSQHERVLRLGENLKKKRKRKNSCNYAGHNQNSKYIN